MMSDQKFDRSDWMYAFWCVAGLMVFFSIVGVVIWGFVESRKPENIKKFAEKRAQEEREEKYADVLVSFDALLLKADTDALRASWQLRRAHPLTKMHRFDEAQKAYEAAQRLDPEGYGKRSSCSEFARALAEAHQYDRAMALWEQLLKDFPNEEHLLGSFGSFLLRTSNKELNNPKRALELIRKYVSVATDRESSGVHRTFSWALAANGLYDEAIHECDRTKRSVIKEHEELVARMEEHYKRDAKHASPESQEHRRKETLAVQQAHERELERLKKMMAELESQMHPEELINPYY